MLVLQVDQPYVSFGLANERIFAASQERPCWYAFQNEISYYIKKNIFLMKRDLLKKAEKVMWQSVIYKRLQTYHKLG